jgi:hypothetical protein
MTLRQTLQYDVASEEYALPLVPTGSSWGQETEWGEPLARLLNQASYLVMAYRYSMVRESHWEIDLSTVCPHAEASTATFASDVEFFHIQLPPDDMLEYDIVLTMPAPRRQAVSLEVKSMKKASPRTVGD